MKKLSFSNNAKNDFCLILSNTFITDYLPYAPSDYVKIYIYCLYECQKNNENWFNDVCTALSVDKSQIMQAFIYWEEVGIVQISDEENCEFVFLEVKEQKERIKYSRGKYAEFNKQFKLILKGRNLTPMELNEYYTLMEDHNIQPEALIMVIKYCLDKQEGNQLSRRYVFNVINDWSENGTLTVEQVEKKLADQTKLNKNIGKIFKYLGISRDISKADIELYQKWTDEPFKFNQQTIVQVIRTVSNIKSLRRLDEILCELHNTNVEKSEIDRYLKDKNSLVELAITINKNLSYYDSNIDNVISTYIKVWQDKGYSDECLITISKYCYSIGKKSLTSMSNFIDMLVYKQIVDISDVLIFISQSTSLKSQFSELINKHGLNISISEANIALFNMWKNTWNFDNAMIDYAMLLAQGAENPLRYVSQLLNNWKKANVATLEMAKSYKVAEKAVIQTQPSKYNESDFDHLIFDVNSID